MNWLCSEVSNDIKGGKVDFADYQIVCPSSYFSIVKNTASLFNLPVSVPIDCVRNIKEVKEFINDVKGEMSLDDLKELDRLLTEAFELSYEDKNIKPKLLRKKIIENPSVKLKYSILIKYLTDLSYVDEKKEKYKILKKIREVQHES